ncbi:hypothetical protein DL546_003784 [Coniochaeta pulveracea]|uniref:Uncharacterized protein n=1 Tax=Coniochaeta pulveracea TaxID=177199 RepID=A0A420Y2T4_9PEZI|nr:hypothetical protein DL546_003784 [Coniochaeta pulveracea]
MSSLPPPRRSRKVTYFSPRHVSGFSLEEEAIARGLPASVSQKDLIVNLALWEFFLPLDDPLRPTLLRLVDMTISQMIDFTGFTRRSSADTSTRADVATWFIAREIQGRNGPCAIPSCSNRCLDYIIFCQQHVADPNEDLAEQNRSQHCTRDSCLQHRGRLSVFCPEHAQESNQRVLCALQGCGSLRTLDAAFCACHRVQYNARRRRERQEQEIRDS